MQTKEGEQLISLKINGCLKNAIIAHEFMHALGFWHEQSRADRDDFIKVVEENIQDKKENNFMKRSYDENDFLDLPYDYNSVMHYSEMAFSKNGLPTIQPLKNVPIGQRKTLSEIDIEEIRLFYNCYAK